MADSKYEEKFEEMQKYLPFLSKVIERLKQADRGEDSPRKAQLQKMQMLYDLLTVKSKKLKMETLLKCEGILIKLHANMEKCNDNDIPKISGTNRQDTSEMKSEVHIIDITGPESPPSQEIEVIQPVLIPTERQFSPITANEQFINDGKCLNDERRHRSNRRHHHQDKDEHNHTKAKTNSVVDTIDLVCDSPSPPPHRNDMENSVRNLSDFNCKSKDDSTHEKVKKDVFERLGEKIDNKFDNFTDFKVNVCNNLADTKLKQGSPPSSSGNLLESQLLSTDMLDMLNESADNLSTSSSNLSISNIGTRRPPKESLESSNETAVSDLDIVRKKLAMISRNSPQFEESPPAPPPFTTCTDPITERGIRTFTNELSKPYIPNSADLHAKSMSNNFGAPNINILPSINPQDPRLRKAGVLNNIVGTPSVQSNFATMYPQGNFGFNVPAMEATSGSGHQRQNDLRYAGPISLSYQREDPRLKQTSGRQSGSYDYCRINNSRIDRTSNESNRIYGHNREVTSNYNQAHKMENVHVGSNPNSARFNAFRNDKTERCKYFESKKQKPLEPRTYGEFKAAKARAAAEEAAKKKGSPKTITVDAKKIHTDLQKTDDSTTSAASFTLPQCSTESTLDKLYRSSNFSAVDFPNKLTSFKIPKKPNTEHKDEKSEISETFKDITDGKSKKVVNEKSKVTVNEQPKDIVSEKQKDVNENRKETINAVTVNEPEYSKSIDQKNNNQLEQSIENIKSNKELVKSFEEKNHKKELVTKDNHVTNANDEIKSNNELNKLDENQVIPLKTNLDQTDKTKEKVESVKCSDFESIKPRRILARRCTMIAYDSAPEIDKEKICSQNALLYEDVQERLSAEQKSKEDKPYLKRNKALADIFRKSDDNCMISTDNIIIGKRRTRTTVNFNEVQQSKAAFKQVDTKKPKETIVLDNASKKKNVQSQCNKEHKTSTKSSIENSSISSSPNSSISYVEENDSECSRLSTSRGTTITQPDEKSKKKMLENFVESLLKPNADKKYIFGLLEQILDAENMSFIKQIIDNGVKEDSKDETNIEVEQEKLNEISEESSCKNNKDSMKHVQNKRKMKKRNELDRLNDDIRDMFICEGVLTATGRRMCTLVAAEEEKETSSNELKITSPIIRKSKVVLTPLSLETIRKIRRANEFPVNDTESESVSHADSQIGTETRIPVITPPRTMPVLKPNTPIKFSEEKEFMPSKETKKQGARELKIKLARVKPCPKSKKLLAMAKATKYAKKASKAQTRSNSQKKKHTKKAKEVVIRNVNLNWHSQSRYARYCGICNINSQFMGIHYKQIHGENYASRLPPGILEKYKDQTQSKPDFCNVNKNESVWFYRCPFCLKHSSKTFQQWVFHFGTHTCEYKFECSKCLKGSCKRHVLQKHCTSKTKCTIAHIVENKLFYVKKMDAVKAHVCHLCNFMQLMRKNLDKHYIEQHDCERSSVASMGYTIDLINMKNVPVVNAQKAIELEKDIFNTEQSDIVIQSDNDDNYLNSSGDSGNSLLAVLEVREVFEEDCRSSRATKKSCKESVVKKRGRKKVSEPHEDIKVKLEQDNPGISNLHFDKEKRVCIGSNVNAFMPTRDTTDSPTLAENLRNIEQEEAEANNKNLLASKLNTSVSIAERLSQRIRNFSDHETVQERTRNVDDITSLSCSNISVNPFDTSDDLVVENEVLNESILPAYTETAPHINISDSKTTITVGTSEQENDIEQQDDDNWEDIEVTESAPSTNSSINSSITRDSRYKNKQLFQKYSRFFNAMGPLTKQKKTTITKKKDVISTDLGEQLVELPKSVESADTSIATEATAAEATAIERPATEATVTEATETEAAATETSLPFRPMILTLEDLLPNSPCNDPQELVPDLAALEPLRDINDESLLLETNVSVPVIPCSTSSNLNQNRKPLEPLKGSDNSIIPNAGNQLIINRIQNIGYSLVKTPEIGCRFYCLSEKCTFLYSSEAIGLENHYHSEHTQIKWNGYCGTCKQQVVDNQLELPLPFSRELQHTLEKHVVQLIQGKELEQKLEYLQSDVGNETKEERPRIKIRRLSGDCLSTTPINRGTPDMEVLGSNDDSTDGNSKLRDMLNMQSKPPKVLTMSSAQLPMQSAANITAREIIEPIIKNLSKRVIVKMVPSKPQATSTSAKTVAPVIPSSLHIAKVISLNDASKNTNVENTSCQQLPKIANVCSLNQSEKDSSVSTIWEQQIQNECIELAHSAAESLELSRLLVNASNSNQCINNRIAVSDSPEPVVVSETVPIAQATSGNFVITQTISTQYNNTMESAETPQLGFNISIAAATPKATPTISTARTMPDVVKINEGTKIIPERAQTLTFVCMGNGCSYQTRVMVAMRDHLQFHERRNFNFNQRDYMRCSLCDYMAEDLDDYFKHAGQDHLRYDSSNSTKQTMENTFKQKLIETIKEIIPSTGEKDAELYRCVITGCKSTLTESTYYSHLSYHSFSLMNSKEFHYKCLFCPAAYQRPAGINSHIKLHARHRFFCYICMITTATVENMLKHFSETHLRTANLHTAILLEQLEIDGQGKTNYIVCSYQQLNNLEVQQFREKLVIDWQRRKAESKTHFKSTQIQLLPKHPIFTKEAHCAECSYRTKVRTNMLRHLQMHLFSGNKNGSGGIAQPVVASVDPVNPVPCLNSSERHFDKMTNLASSSNSGGNTNNGSSTTTASASIFKIQYAYVPEMRRYTCGVQQCHYLTVTDDIFRIHLSTLHGDILLYKCPFCQEDICKRGMSTERILQHLRYHGERLYRCEECDYLHYMKPVVERHINERHPEQRVNLISHIRNEDYTLEGTATCQAYIGKRGKDINAKTNKGLKDTSPGSKFKQDETNASKVRDIAKPATDTRPLWMRDDPTRVRHIRGILMEDEEESEELRKSLSSLYEYDDEVDDSAHKSNTSVVSTVTADKNNKTDPPIECPTNDLVLGIYEFSCFQCGFVRRNFDEINQHWQDTHKQDVISVRRPFLCRLISQLRCPYCLTFTGNYMDLEQHLQKEHNTKAFVAADVRTTKLTCGFCYMNFHTMNTFLRHNRRESHDPRDLKLLSSENLDKLLQMGTRNTNDCYIQCKVCNEIFANAFALQLHLRSKHDDDALKIGHTELRNVLVYCCPLCMNMTGDEMTTLRHMIDHYVGFKRCHFCQQPQSNFNGYMQHCYADHREGINRFSEIYKQEHIRRYLQQMLIIFPNGIVLDKKNLCYTKYGSEARINQLYEEICKTAKEPPIPRLSIARLVARKSIEAQQSFNSIERQSGTVNHDGKFMSSTSTAAAMQLAGNGNTIPPNAKLLTAKKICKRRSTVAFGLDDAEKMPTAYLGMFVNKKRKSSLVPPFPPPTSESLPETITASTNSEKTGENMTNTTNSDENVIECPTETLDSEVKPYSFYGTKPEPIDLGKIYTRISVGGKNTPLSLSKFQLLFKIDCRVVVEQCDISKYAIHSHTGKRNRMQLDDTDGADDDSDSDSITYRHIKKPCPASHKYKYKCL